MSRMALRRPFKRLATLPWLQTTIWTVMALIACLAADWRHRTNWPVAKLYTTANDCYTGERLIVGQTVAQKNGIPLAHATAASSSLPGVIGPTLLGERYCMDGGISRTWAHADVVAGSKRAIVITLTNGYEGSLLSGIPHNIYEEMNEPEGNGNQRHAHHRRHAARREPPRPPADRTGAESRL